MKEPHTHRGYPGERAALLLSNRGGVRSSENAGARLPKPSPFPAGTGAA